MAAHFLASPLLIGATVEAPPIRFLANELPSGNDASLGDGQAFTVCHTQRRYIKRPEAPRTASDGLKHYLRPQMSPHNVRQTRVIRKSSSLGAENTSCAGILLRPPNQIR